MTAREAIAWMRICRPGSVIGQQQGWLEKIESWLWRQGSQYRYTTKVCVCKPNNQKRFRMQFQATFINPELPLKIKIDLAT